MQDCKIPKALCNDNFVGYVHRFFVENDVTFLEATIACPVFTGSITYYVEGSFAERHHMLEEPVGHPERTYGIRGNIFVVSLGLDGYDGPAV